VLQRPPHEALIVGHGLHGVGGERLALPLLLEDSVYVVTW
jgi:hypothetical protein